MTADGLVVDGASSSQQITFSRTVSSTGTGKIGSDVSQAMGLWGTDGTKVATFSQNKDISFYEDTGTTPKFFWDASTERLGIGTSSPSKPLTVYDASTNRPALIQSGDADSLIEFKDNSTSYAPAVGATGNDIIIQTGAAALERLRITSSGYVSIGNSSPSALLDVGTASGGEITISTDGAPGSIASKLYTTLNFKGSSNTIMAQIQSWDESQSTNVGYLTFSTRRQVGAVRQLEEAMRIDSAGNVGIGTNTVTDYSGTALQIHASSGSAARIKLTNATSGSTTATLGGSLTFETSNILSLLNRSEGAITLGTSNTERLRIDSSGNLALGSTNAYSHRFFARGSGADETVGLAVGANDTNVIRFYSSTLGTAGAIRVSAAGTSVAYNTSSDYRLKEDDVPMTGATERIKALRPINFAWKADGSRVDGFFAHELAEVVPEAATGTKDAMKDEEYEITPAVVDAEGNETESAVMGTRSVPDYQGIDQSKLVPLLTATIQELIARIEILEAK